MTKTIKILGAGVSGLTAAINLAKAGYKVKVFERSKDAGLRFGGDLQGFENWSEKEDFLEKLKEMNIAVNFDCDPFYSVTLANTSQSHEVKFAKPILYLVKRGVLPGSLDQGLKKQALEAGVRIYFGETIPEEEVRIVATGPIMDKVAGIAKGITFKTNAEDTITAIFDDNAAFKGYSYLIITKGYGCMSTAVTKDFKCINDCFRKTEKLFPKIKKFDIREPRKFSGVASYFVKSRFRKNKKLFVGEAAGLQDALWGFGMRYAFTSGFMAARSIIENTDYEKAAEEYFSPKLKSAMVNRYLWERTNGANYASLINRIKNTSDPLSTLYSMHNYNFLQKLIYPFALSHFKRSAFRHR